MIRRNKHGFMALWAGVKFECLYSGLENHGLGRCRGRLSMTRKLGPLCVAATDLQANAQSTHYRSVQTVKVKAITQFAESEQPGLDSTLKSMLSAQIRIWSSLALAQCTPAGESERGLRANGCANFCSGGPGGLRLASQDASEWNRWFRAAVRHRGLSSFLREMSEIAHEHCQPRRGRVTFPHSLQLFSLENIFCLSLDFKHTSRSALMIGFGNGVSPIDVRNRRPGQRGLLQIG